MLLLDLESGVHSLNHISECMKSGVFELCVPCKCLLFVLVIGVYLPATILVSIISEIYIYIYILMLVCCSFGNVWAAGHARSSLVIVTARGSSTTRTNR